jgi:hypothetical protein
LCAIFLGFKSRHFFVFSIVFLLFSGILKVLGISIWAERSAIYMFQALFLGELMLIYEYLSSYRKKSE